METHTQEEVSQWVSLITYYKFALDEMDTKLTILNEEFQHVHDHNPIEHLKSRVKSMESIQRKLERKGLEVTAEHAEQHIHDIAGVRVTCSFESDIYKLVNILCNQDDVHVQEVKDYIQHPKSNGYKSLHLIVQVPVFLSTEKKLMNVEIQIRTVAMDFWASLEHKIYYKFDKTVPKHLTDELKEAADLANYLDKKMEGIRTKMDKYKESAPLLDELFEHGENSE
ncbi:GTP pyrophosphokinase [Pontibacillus halophilus JSM 076056 = DSM 19796]|uniref:GTP pyrophosphokinase n=1 Tax=Pontibacillus halophilus JSM 076056 = DSM 19796 TaxID=1385510 RepID=A0A0A5I3Y5_9BACI|nr:GTP pyrophosphokinase [Pontibacillus halophilus JSM 076056 = DSM 19796]